MDGAVRAAFDAELAEHGNFGPALVLVAEVVGAVGVDDAGIGVVLQEEAGVPFAMQLSMRGVEPSADRSLTLSWNSWNSWTLRTWISVLRWSGCRSVRRPTRLPRSAERTRSAAPVVAASDSSASRVSLVAAAAMGRRGLPVQARPVQPFRKDADVVQLVERPGLALFPAGATDRSPTSRRR